MNFLKNILFVFLLTSSLICSANAAQNSSTFSKFESKFDNIDFYKNIVANKSNDTEVEPGKDGIILGSGLTVFGIMCLMSATSSNESKDKSNKKSSDSIGDAVGDAVEAGKLTFMGVVCTLIGLPILIYNGYKYSQQAQEKT
jgi:hypothetical protein